MSRYITVLTLALASPLRAQSAAPEHWQWALDSAAQHITAATDKVPPGTFTFATMPPGWHVTMGPGGLLYDTRLRAEQRYSLESRMFLFPGEPAAEYGLFVGGRDLGGTTAQWVAFVLRRDGSAAVLRHQQGKTEVLHPWTRHEAVKGGAEGASNIIGVAVDTAVVFSVNGTPVATLPRTQVATDGSFGFRVGKNLNLHVTTLDLTQRLAPPRRAAP